MSVSDPTVKTRSLEKWDDLTVVYFVYLNLEVTHFHSVLTLFLVRVRTWEEPEVERIVWRVTSLTLQGPRTWDRKRHKGSLKWPLPNFNARYLVQESGDWRRHSVPYSQNFSLQWGSDVLYFNDWVPISLSVNDSSPVTQKRGRKNFVAKGTVVNYTYSVQGLWQRIKPPNFIV